MYPKYNWQQSDWPHFDYDETILSAELQLFAQKVGYLQGILTGLPAPEAKDALLEILISEALKTAEIEGDLLSRKDVRSSIQNNLGLAGTPFPVADHRAAGISALIVEVRKTFIAPLTALYA